MSENKAVATAKKELPEGKIEKKLTASERFVNKLIEKLSVGKLEVKMTNFQKRLAQSYMIGINKAIMTAESKRYAPKNDLAYSWNTIRIDEDLADAIVSYARCGLDPMQPNHISPVLYKDNKANQYVVSFIIEYRGRELRAKKYGLDVPDTVVVELVYSNDKFKVIKKSKDNPVESYEFEIVDAFDRGEIKGGFWYHSYTNNPEKNKIVVMTKKDIDRRKPEKAAAEFWGGEKDIWEKDEKTGKNKKVGTEQVEGWYEKMAWKTLYHDAYRNITIDPQKIDEDYYRMEKFESKAIETEVEEEISDNANSELIDIEDEAIEADYNIEAEEETATVEGEPNQAEPQQKVERPAPKQTSRATGRQKNQDQEQPRNLVDMAEEGPGY